MNLKEGDLVVVDIKKITKRDNSPRYIKMVKATIKRAKGKLYIHRIENGLVQVSSWKYDPFYVIIPEESIIKIVGNDSNYKINK